MILARLILVHLNSGHQKLEHEKYIHDMNNRLKNIFDQSLTNILNGSIEFRKNLIRTVLLSKQHLNCNKIDLSKRYEVVMIW